MALGFLDGYVTSIFGRRLGLQQLSSSQSGTTKTPKQEFLIGPATLRMEVVTETTGTNLGAGGVSLLSTGGATTTNGFFVIDPPIPGVKKTVIFGSTNTATNGLALWASTGTVFITTATSTATQLTSSAGWCNAVEMIGKTTSAWAIIGSLSTGNINSTATT